MPSRRSSSLQDRVKEAASGAVLKLPAGATVLDEPLEIEKPLTLRGAGARKSILRGKGKGALLSFRGPGTLRVEGLTLERIGGLGDVLVCTGGRLEVEACRVAGAKLKGKEGGVGLSLGGKAVAVIASTLVEECEVVAVYAFGRAKLTARDNEVRGGGDAFHVDEDATAELVDNRCAKNRNAGVAFTMRGKGLARGNVCEGARVAFWASDEAAPRFERNRGARSRDSGFYIAGAARPTAEGNVIEGGGRNGFFVEGTAAPTLIGNVVRGNSFSGIAFFGGAKGRAEGNTCEKNKQHGLYVDGEATPELVGNTSRGNGWSGLAVAGSSRPTARGNQLVANHGSGASVLERAQPRLLENEVHQNEAAGLVFEGEAKGEAKGNRISENESAGIWLTDSAAPLLERNLVEENGDSGIDYAEGTPSGTARRNVVRKNPAGISIAGGAAPRIEGNECRENQGDGIQIVDDARPTIEGNVISGNEEYGIACYAENDGVVVKGNQCLENGEDGIFIELPARPRIERNVCKKNGGRGVMISGYAKHRSAEPKVVGNTCEDNALAEDPIFGTSPPWDVAWKKLRKSPAAPVLRRAFLPRTEAGDGKATESKLGGLPWLADGEKWPACGHCGKPMPLLLQLDLGKAPEDDDRVWGEGLLQLFYCTNPDAPCNDLGGNRLARIVRPERGGAAAKAPKIKKAPPPRRITGWAVAAEVPSWHELKALKLKSLPKDVRAGGFSYDDGRDGDEVGKMELDAQLGDKLGGWPRWIQSRDVPRCPTCRSEMRLLFQLDENNNLEIEWGDAGCSYLFQCPEHPEQLDFAWQTH